ncbi:helix-turn-helix transcriptional regulator [Streptomyces chartreusis]|uniref:helix-turn-helix transcriptional regulator n=1 Tax=Streptomyces chartreusis TaxID=1969 RepID=UPI0038223570
MLMHQLVAAATRIGMLTREHDTGAACTQALYELQHAVPYDAVTLLGIDPISGAHLQVAGVGYTDASSQKLCAEFVATPWYDNVVRQRLPLSMSGEPEDLKQAFRNGWFYADRVRPMGFHDGMTGVLRHEGRIVGLIHLSTELPDVYDADARCMLASVLPALGTLVRPTMHASDLCDIPAEASASLVTTEGIINLPGRQPARVLMDEGFRQLIEAFVSSGGLRLRMLWPFGRGWCRVALRKCTTGPAAIRQAVLVSETVVELPFGLTPRELEVLTRASLGQTNHAIARALALSPRTVHSHIDHLLRKTGCGSRAEATALAVRDGILKPSPSELGQFVERGPSLLP